MSLLARLGKAIVTFVFSCAVHVLTSMILWPMMHALGVCPLIGPISQVAFSYFISKLVGAILLAAVGRNFPQVAAAAGYVPQPFIKTIVHSAVVASVCAVKDAARCA
ncbi:uncharacterized protein EHS24_002217 [Apiotrichum porosum]|uniref:Uncharacterized protein n=1 Tax=Apiotrichum porosum TaxID=105984 RepID=A0A427XI34_9TREE|nr:uncharacterized protein EHS24_002217 [Apiotrichum porosum]RSH78492.1 hypothetical protein EHS24_002217 [Apiotrichum porosum]